MSSFIGHGLAALTVYAMARPARPVHWNWLIWLAVLALAPDVDYLVASLRLPGTPLIRVTHSLAGCLALPALTSAVLFLRGERGARLGWQSLQAACAGLSHVALDVLVGVTPAALLWPFSRATFVFPVGVLPSAGWPRLSNPYFYRNLLIELGVLVPSIASLLLLRHGALGVRARVLWGAGLALLSLGFMVWAASLSR
ncbi:metal-dependent hydrolase [Stigmatella sp. ncwal1]|uniref:Metal-dependent hydrolase n=1 Tax=Stigmatella ashevillensis TaxID=2995309 RepID=A0ABT5DJE8_9BACT|nr:metal-dependent hydrolase [Stigmatella ashevillena]MDC0712486.1 metal-dependent hydrolase [Stigmatella ashevillena]